MTTAQFMGPYDTNKVLSGVLTALPKKRPNWFQSFFTTAPPTNKTTVNFDVEYGTKNVMGMFVDAKVDADPIKLGTFGHKELTFSYSKEKIDSDEFDELNSRQLGDQFGQVDVMRNYAARFLQKTVKAEERFQNLFEKTASEIFLYGGYVAESEKHQTVRYEFGRTVITTAADLFGAAAKKLIPSVNLTTTAVTSPWGSTVLPVVATDGGISYTAGMKVWSKTNIDNGDATPVEDLTVMLQTCNERATAKAVHMSDDAYKWFEYDVNKNYKEAADTNILVAQTIERVIMPQLEVVDGLTFRRMWKTSNGVLVPIYTNNAHYNTRADGTETKYVGSGWVLVIPDTGAIKIYGRIMHKKANWNAQPRFINYWQNQKTGEEEWEIHTSFLMGHTKIDASVAWKVI
jgi:hypothetical protein